MKAAINNIWKTLKGIILFIVSLILIIPLGIWGIIELVINILYKEKIGISLGRIGNVFKSLATIVDLLGNVLLQVVFNRVLITNGGYQFGHWRNTISYVLGKNENTLTLTPTGLKLVNALNFIDKDHCQKALSATKQQ